MLVSCNDAANYLNVIVRTHYIRPSYYRLYCSVGKYWGNTNVHCIIMLLKVAMSIVIHTSLVILYYKLISLNTRS